MEWKSCWFWTLVTSLILSWCPLAIITEFQRGRVWSWGIGSHSNGIYSLLSLTMNLKKNDNKIWKRMTIKKKDQKKNHGDEWEWSGWEWICCISGGCVFPGKTLTVVSAVYEIVEHLEGFSWLLIIRGSKVARATDRQVVQSWIRTCIISIEVLCRSYA